LQKSTPEGAKMNSSWLLLLVCTGIALGSIIGAIKAILFMDKEFPVGYPILGGILGTIAFVILFFAKSL
jgi:hypothetical protein